MKPKPVLRYSWKWQRWDRQVWVPIKLKHGDTVRIPLWLQANASRREGYA